MPVPGATISTESLKEIARLTASIEDPKKLLTRWGALMLGASQKAFKEQKFGDVLWAPRYPSQQSPFLNVAGTIKDFNEGRPRPKPNRFENRPANVDEGLRGGIWGSLDFRVLDKETVEEGTNKPYAERQNSGGKTRIDLSESGHALMKNWLYTKKGNVRKGRESYAQKLWHVMRTGIHSQTIIARPFLGFPAELVTDIISETKRFFQGKPGE